MLTSSYLFLHRAHFKRSLRDYAAEPFLSPFQLSYVAELIASRAVLEVLRDAL